MLPYTNILNVTVNVFFFILQDVFQLSETTSSPLSGAEGLKQMADARQEKIRKYKEQKQQEHRLKVSLITWALTNS